MRSCDRSCGISHAPTTAPLAATMALLSPKPHIYSLPGPVKTGKKKMVAMRGPKSCKSCALPNLNDFLDPLQRPNSPDTCFKIMVIYRFKGVGIVENYHIFGI